MKVVVHTIPSNINAKYRPRPDLLVNHSFTPWHFQFHSIFVFLLQSVSVCYILLRATSPVSLLLHSALLTFTSLLLFPFGTTFHSNVYLLFPPSPPHFPFCFFIVSTSMRPYFYMRNHLRFQRQRAHISTFSPINVIEIGNLHRSDFS